MQIENESIDQEYAPTMSLDNNTLVAPSGEQNAELTPTENRSPRVVPGPLLPVGPPRHSTSCLTYVSIPKNMMRNCDVLLN